MGALRGFNEIHGPPMSRPALRRGGRGGGGVGERGRITEKYPWMGYRG